MARVELSRIHIGSAALTGTIYIGAVKQVAEHSEFSGEKVDRTSECIRAVADLLADTTIENDEETLIDLNDGYELAWRRKQ
jgi:hypothetical protein